MSEELASGDKSTPNEQTRTQAAVEKWINSQGYPLEYRAYAAFWNHFYSEAHLGGFIQASQGQPREVDVWAQMKSLDPKASDNVLFARDHRVQVLERISVGIAFWQPRKNRSDDGIAPHAKVRQFRCVLPPRS